MTSYSPPGPTDQWVCSPFYAIFHSLIRRFRYANQYPKAISLVSSGVINMKPLVTHKLPLDQAVQAFHTTADPKSRSIKVQIMDM
jgi:L-iditol 2-dehydrogenase